MKYHQFQFHKGTIKTVTRNETKYTIRNFNSIKVRLKLAAAGLSAVGSALFQFHKGTIKTPFFKSSNSVDTIFQFHKGTIKTEDRADG